jgi:hypothetical protein
MLNVKSVIFKIAVLPGQSRKLTTARPQRAIQKNQQLMPGEQIESGTELRLPRHAFLLGIVDIPQSAPNLLALMAHQCGSQLNQ